MRSVALYRTVLGGHLLQHVRKFPHFGSSHSVKSMANAFQDRSFGPWTVHGSEVFCESDLSYAFVNLKPVVPGHVLVSSKRVVPRFLDLSDEESTDLWRLAKRVAGVVQEHRGVGALTLVIQDGADAGQTVPHVHVHVLPRRRGDFQENDRVYDAIDAASEDQADALRSHAEHLGKDVHVDAKASEERVPRSAEDMAAEARELRLLFE